MTDICLSGDICVLSTRIGRPYAVPGEDVIFCRRFRPREEEETGITYIVRSHKERKNLRHIILYFTYT